MDWECPPDQGYCCDEPSGTWGQSVQQEVETHAVGWAGVNAQAIVRGEPPECVKESYWCCDEIDQYDAAVAIANQAFSATLTFNPAALHGPLDLWCEPPNYEDPHCSSVGACWGHLECDRYLWRPISYAVTLSDESNCVMYPDAFGLDNYVRVRIVGMWLGTGRRSTNCATCVETTEVGCDVLQMQLRVEFDVSKWSEIEYTHSVSDYYFRIVYRGESTVQEWMTGNWLLHGVHLHGGVSGETTVGPLAGGHGAGQAGGCDEPECLQGTAYGVESITVQNSYWGGGEDGLVGNDYPQWDVWRSAPRTDASGIAVGVA